MSNFPNQKLTTKEKIAKYKSVKEWGKAMFNSVKSIANVSTVGLTGYSRDKKVLRNLYDGILNVEDFTYVLKPYGDVTAEYPAELRHYDRISNKVHLLVGEEIKRPFNFRAVAINPEAVTEFENQIKQRMIEAIMQQVQLELQNAGLAQGEEINPEEIETPEEVIKLAERDLQTQGEIEANNALNYFKQFLDIEEKFNKGWEDLIVTGDDIFYTSISNNEPLLRRVDGEYFDYDRTQTVDYIEDAQWAYEARWMPVAQVYDEFGEYLEDNDIDALEKMKGTFNQNIGYGAGVPIHYMRDLDYLGGSNRSGYSQIASNSVVRVVNFVWKSLRKIGFVIYEDEETGDVLEKIVDENYRKQPEDLEIEWKWINEVWELTQAGTDLIIRCEPRRNQYKSLDNPNKCRLPYTGIS
jgi:hypothetical protein